ncbi:hypothetical protein CBR_g48017 [Chara braunii]|uniref:Uncharacterized protein n=1 Tax=Chara braunii TaxID=69332 RepID=A0A388M1T7_CHABU|nr:hypothetical protein CBR_g48017 [Chara braunii]|eukprot:GBG88548.1 hypothetical protein CBR_g48017 [Chara braunii]
MDLILEDIGGIDWVASRIAQARLVTRFFKRHGHAREVLEAHSTKTLLLPAKTRFGTNVIMMERLVELRTTLTDVVGDDRWRETVWSTGKIRKNAAEVTACIGSPPWWEDLRALCKMLEPIMDMLKLVDSDTHQISKILRLYDEMIASCLSACRDIDRDQQEAIVEVFHRRCTMFKTPAHTTAMLLDPEFRDPTLCDDAEVQQALVEALQRLRRGGRRDDSIASRVCKRRGHIAIDMGARVMRQDPVVVSEDEMGDPSNETRLDQVHAEAQASVTDAMVTEEDTSFGITHPRSPAPVVGTEEETDFGGHGTLRQAQTQCTTTGGLVHSTGAGLEDGEARREPPPHTSDGVLEDEEVAPTPTSGQDGEDERPPTVEQGLAEEVARNRRGGPPVAAQRSLGGSLEAASGDFVAQGDHGSHQLSDGVSSVRPPDEGEQREPHRGSTETLEARHPGVICSDEGVAHDTAQPGSANTARSIGEGIEHIGSSTAHDVGGGGAGVWAAQTLHDGRGGVDGGDRVDESGRGEKRRGGTMIIHDDSSTTAEGGETTGDDDPDDSNCVPRIRTADKDDGGGRRGVGVEALPLLG